MRTAESSPATAPACRTGLRRYSVRCVAPVLAALLCSACHVAEPPLPPAENQEEAFLGVAYRHVSLQKYGRTGGHAYRIDRVVPNSAAAAAGLRDGDLILRYDGRKIKEGDKAQVFKEYLQQYKRAGSPLRVQILRELLLWNGRQNGRSIELRDRHQLAEILNAQEPEQTLSFRVRRRRQSLSLTIQLGKRGNVDEIPENANLFPDYEKLRGPTRQRVEELFDKHQLGDAYTQWSERQNQDEHWDDGRRLPIVRYLRRDPLQMLPVMEEQSDRLLRQLRERDFSAGLASLLALQNTTALLSATATTATTTIEATGATEKPAIDELLQILQTAYRAREQALAQLSDAERDWLRIRAPEMLARLANSYDIDYGQSLEVQQEHRRVLQLGDRIDMQKMLHSLQWLMLALEPTRLASLRTEWKTRKTLEKKPAGVAGEVLFFADSTAGRIVVGGYGANRYTGNFALIIDLGGNDLYRDTGEERDTGIHLIIDLDGDDEYSATQDFAQGSGILGNSVLFDRSGDDLYRGVDFVQGAGVFGGGVLLDLAGDDSYRGRRFAQGISFFGIGLLNDHRGEDEYEADLFAQGVGVTSGIAALVDLSGDDHYLCGGRYRSSYGTGGIFRGSGQGFGVGLRYHASGGIGMLLDGGGSDSMEAGNFAQGTGYFFGLGVLRSFGPENDRYLAARYGQGSAAHSALGLMIEDGGDEQYRSTFGGVILGSAWDLAAAIFEDRGGDDRYGRRALHFSAGSAAHTSFSLFSDLDGEDVHYPGKADRAWHQKKDKINLGLFLDLGGAQDLYPGLNPDPNRHSRLDGGRYGLWHDE